MQLLAEDTTKMHFSYDGKIRALVYEEDKRIVIDSFKTSPGPFRIVGAPFFTKAKTIIEYILETKDSLKIETKDFGDSVQYSFSIYDTVPEVIGNRIIYPPSQFGSHKGEVSKYELWINKSDNLPYRILRDMPHDKSIETSRDDEVNKINIKDFKAREYFASDYTIQPYRTGKSTKKTNLLGKIAPDWVLEDTDNNRVSLRELNCKILLIQFTGIGCGPCQVSVPLLKQLATDYEDKDFKLVSIETWSSNIRALKGYQQKNALNYPFLKSTEEVTQHYQARGVPVFYILDQNRVIRKVINGYVKGTTDKEIRDAINELI